MIITNVTELIRSSELTALLRLCGAEEKAIGENSADYEYFQALCKAIPLLKGHPLIHGIHRLFASMNIVFSFDTLDAHLLWKQSAAFLERNFVPMPDCICDDYSNTKTEDFPLTNKGSYSFTDTKGWTETQTNNWKNWERELTARWETIAPQNTIVCFDLPFPSSKLSLYHVENALKTKDKSILSAQLLRFLSSSCQKKQTTLLIKTETNSVNDLMLHLQHLEKTIGLPNLILSVYSTEVFHSLLPFVAQKHDADIRFGVPIENGIPLIPLQQIAAEYPIGRLFLYQKIESALNAFSIT